MPKKFYVTTPIYYVNDVPHIGHSYTTIAADVLARYHRLLGEEVFFLTGTDEHGAKVAASAKESGKTPQEFCDEVADRFKKTWKLLNISNNCFIRTTDKEHEESVQKFLAKINERGFIYKGEYEGLYCQGCERFYLPDDLVDGKCPFHFTKPRPITEENYFFKLSFFQDKLIKLIETAKFEIFPEERRNEVLGKLKSGVEDISISRGSVEWGVSFPLDSSHTVYVWVDALINYISAVGYGRKENDFLKWWPAQVHLMAKDILWFHAVIWPAMLLAAELELPRKLFVHGFFTVNKQKMSKSLGNVIDPWALSEKYGVDGIRHFLLSEFPFGADGDFSIRRLEERYNSDLANDLGNLLHRFLPVVVKSCQGKVPDPAGKPTHLEKELEALSDEVTGNVTSLMEQLKLKETLEEIWRLVRKAHKYLDETAPWSLAKAGETERLSTVIYNLAEIMRIIALLISPFMPTTAEKFWKQLGVEESLATQILPQGARWGGFRPGAMVKLAQPLFPRLEID